MCVGSDCREGEEESNREVLSDNWQMQYVKEKAANCDGDADGEAGVCDGGWIRLLRLPAKVYTVFVEELLKKCGEKFAGKDSMKWRSAKGLDCDEGETYRYPAMTSQQRSSAPFIIHLNAPPTGLH